MKRYQSSALLALCEGNLPVTGGFPSQRASNAESFSMSWRHHELCGTLFCEVSGDLDGHFGNDTWSMTLFFKSLLTKETSGKYIQPWSAPYLLMHWHGQVQWMIPEGTSGTWTLKPEQNVFTLKTFPTAYHDPSPKHIQCENYLVGTWYLRSRYVGQE